MLFSPCAKAVPQTFPGRSVFQLVQLLRDRPRRWFGFGSRLSLLNNILYKIKSFFVSNVAVKYQGELLSGGDESSPAVQTLTLSAYVQVHERQVQGD